jgi:hypothetical protein
MILTVSPKGTVRCLYQEHLDLDSLGPSETVRASRVEPSPNGWTADLAPVGGPVLGPFAKQSQALSAEVEYLEKHVL